MVSHSGFEDQTRLFLNRGDGTFEDRTESAGLAGEVGGLNMVQADYDNDGFVDVLVLRGGWMGPAARFPLSLLRNNGERNLHGRDEGRRVCCAPCTYPDGDVARLRRRRLARPLRGQRDRAGGIEDPSPCELFHNNRNGTFTERRPRGGRRPGRLSSRESMSGDYNNDGRPDLFVSVQGSDNLLFRNDGPSNDTGGWRFTNVATEAGVTEPTNSFGAFFFDYDNDGWPDLYVAGCGGFEAKTMAADVAADYLGLPTSAERGRLYRNKGDGTFEDVTKAAGLYRVVPAMGLNFGDLDNDGWLDLYLGTGNPDLAL